jgi:hypothetical protein
MRSDQKVLMLSSYIREIALRKDVAVINMSCHFSYYMSDIFTAYSVASVVCGSYFSVNVALLQIHFMMS